MNCTPGPWSWTYGQSVHLFSGEGRQLLEVQRGAAWNATADDQRLIAAAPRMREALLKLEWSGRGLSGDPYVCPSCGLAREFQHGPDCELAALLEDLR